MHINDMDDCQPMQELKASLVNTDTSVLCKCTEITAGQTNLGPAWAQAPMANTNVKAYAAPAFNDRTSIDNRLAAPPTEAQLDHRHTPRPFRPFKRQVSRDIQQRINRTLGHDATGEWRSSLDMGLCMKG